ncbi:High affinity cAMP-specific and IBMX-insensitive 3',5'-cyclic phosphodiesterase 9A [Allomyces arbusculus]|nr:High affinity cAMP-specific and IBMX-insensitive 3',5'-cyclic phosphodiesterase 9A [Allomyces arbusculus]
MPIAAPDAVPQNPAGLAKLAASDHTDPSKHGFASADSAPPAIPTLTPAAGVVEAARFAVQYRRPSADPTIDPAASARNGQVASGYGLIAAVLPARSHGALSNAAGDVTLDDWDLAVDVHLPTIDAQVLAVVWLLEDAGALDVFPKTTTADLVQFVSVVAANYNAPPFHRFAHAVSVAQAAHVMMRALNVKEELSKEAVVMLLVAGVCHDVDHQGFTNMYHCATESDLATMYNNTCPMENHHAAVTNALLQSEYSPLRHMDPAAARQFRSGVTQLILATDMGKHESILVQGARVPPVTSTGEIAQWEAPQRMAFLQVLLKAADLSNELRAAPVADPWSAALYRELNHEQDVLGRARLDTGAAAAAAGQIEFLQLKVKPIVMTLATILGAERALPVVDRANAAIARHQQRHAAAAGTVKSADSSTSDLDDESESRESVSETLPGPMAAGRRASAPHGTRTEGLARRRFSIATSNY